MDLDPLLPERPGPAAAPMPRTWSDGRARQRAHLGVHITPLVQWSQQPVWLKCDHLQPTGSFKDRGAELMVAAALEAGASHVVTDSSGNAGTALAAHATHAGLRCTVFLPRGVSAGKLRQIAAYGAEPIVTDAPRSGVSALAEDHARRTGALYLAHTTNPHFIDGTKSWLYEAYQQLPQLTTVAVPVGSGSLLLGVLRAVDELLAVGWLDTRPRLVLAQAAGYASLATTSANGRPATSDCASRTAVTDGRAAGSAGPRMHPLAEGIALADPPRLDLMRKALTDYRYSLVVLSDDDIGAAQHELAHSGHFVEPTSAAAFSAAIHHDRPAADEHVVVALTGSGLKTLPTGN